MSEWDAWIGREETRQDRVDKSAVARWLATFDRSTPPDGSVPQAYHWCLRLDDIDAAEGRGRLIHQRLDRRRIAQVHRDEFRGAALGLDHRDGLVAAMGIDVGDDDLRALARHGDRRGAAHALPAAGDDADAAREPRPHATAGGQRTGHSSGTFSTAATMPE